MTAQELSEKLQEKLKLLETTQEVFNGYKIRDVTATKTLINLKKFCKKLLEL